MAVTWEELKAARTARRRLRARALLSRIPTEWLAVATTAPCRYIAAGARCGRRPTRLYRMGRRCWWHAPTPITYTRSEALCG